MASSAFKRGRAFAVLCIVSPITVAGFVYGAGTRVDATSSGMSVSASGLLSGTSSANVANDLLAQTTQAIQSTSIADDSRTHPVTKAQDSASNRSTNAPQQIFFRYNGVDANYGKLAFVENGDVEHIHFVDDLMCEVAYVAGGRGICLSAERRILGIFAATLFDPKTFQVLGKVPIQGVPSRARVSADGKIAVFTVFTSGHGYASTSFSTQTLLIDVAKAQILANVEEFSVTRDGQPFKNRDFNFWGVTFSPDSKHFYSTLSTQGQHLLVEADIARRSAVVIHENVECPSLSPDGSRIAYKKRLASRGEIVWGIRTLDLATGRETPLAEKRSVDDQLEWMDNDHLLYTLPESETRATPSTNVWRIAADGSSPPQLFLKKASSPAAVR